MANENDFNKVDKQKHGKLMEFLNSVRSLDVAGKKIIQLPDGEFAEYILMEEEYFVDNWLTQFAIGFIDKTNYFNQDGWYRLTDGFTKGVIVINAEKDPVVIIRKFIDMDMSVNNQSYLEYYVRTIGANAKFNPNKAEVDDALNELTNIVEKLTEQNPDYDTLTMMVPWDYYLSKGVNPRVLKQVIYIRDKFTYQDQPIAGNDELLKQIEDILYRNDAKKVISFSEKKLINEITGNTFIFHDGGNIVETNSHSSDEQKEFNPLSD
ncbi:hypothetical protein AH04_70 [Erwinia phage AH04]|uniref:Uncharacterized protein n=1 Tax=Erwinia phage AH04 TaxID=2869569 RepID=A0AAE7X0V6_9CAUD|nr:hypothetical protein PQC02_gp244 [Erwinia phage AH04]QZA70553.1 hypothetical protein AH04_70 [Erwinia phage AH04]